MARSFATRFTDALGFAYRKVALLISEDESDDGSAPTLTAGSGAPSASENTASAYFRASNGYWYRRIGGAWELVAGDAGSLSANVISELTAAAGVTIDGLLLKDGFVVAVDNQGLKLGTGVDDTLSHDGTSTTWTHTTGDLVFDSTDVDDQIIFRVGTDTTATGFEFRNNSDVAMWSINPISASAGRLIAPDNSTLVFGTGSDDTISHNGTNTIWSHITGDLIFDNVLVTGSTIMLLGTDTSAVDFQVQNNSGASLFTVTPTSATGGTVVASGLRAVSATAAAITGVTTLTAADSGGVFSVAKTSAYAITLPTPAQGLKFKFLILDTGANAVTFSDGAAHLFGQIQEAGTAPIAMTGTTITAAASQNVGDWLCFEGIDATHYLVTGSSIQASKFTVA